MATQGISITDHSENALQRRRRVFSGMGSFDSASASHREALAPLKMTSLPLILILLLILGLRHSQQTSNKNCHPERSLSGAKRQTNAVEGPLALEQQRWQSKAF
jgi:hypothetical protein